MVSIFRWLLSVCFSLLRISWVILEVILWVDSELLIHQKVCDPDPDLLPPQAFPQWSSGTACLVCDRVWFLHKFHDDHSKNPQQRTTPTNEHPFLISLVQLVQRNFVSQKTSNNTCTSWMLVPRFYDSDGCYQLTRIDICHPHHRPGDTFEKVLILEGSAL